MLDSKTRQYAFKIMNKANTVIVGEMGSSKNNADFIYKLEGETKILYNNSKKGLSEEILKYYQNRISVDPNGTVDLYVE